MSEPKNHKTLSMREGDQLVQTARRVLLDGGYPNPDRVGCPGTSVLRKIASRKMPIAEADRWVDHLNMCSPCFIEYTAIRERAAKRKKLEFALAMAAMVAVIVIGGWLWRTHRFPGFGGGPNLASVVPVTLNLENRGVFRGPQPPWVPTGPVYLPRGRLDLTVLLPLGSEAGNYGVLVATKSRKLLLEAKGPAVIRRDGVTVLKVRLDDSKLKPGSYTLGIGEIGSEPYSYPLDVR